MLSDPRTGLVVSLAVSALSGMWLAAQLVIGDELAKGMGMGRHAVTYFAIVVLVSGVAAALVFARFHRVRSDLLAGRNVIAEWTVEPELFRQHAAAAARSDLADKRGALATILAFTVVIFGAFALFDQEAAPGMLAIGGGFALLVVLAFLYGNRVRRIQLQPRSGRVIVGRDGVLVNDVLHVWRLILTWLDGATLDDGPPAVLTIRYSVLGRAGPQPHAISLPVPDEAKALAEVARRRLSDAAR